MTTLKAALGAGRTYPGWVLWALWIAATFVGTLIYFVPVGLVYLLLGLDRLGDPQRAGEISAGMMALAAVLCGAASGATIGTVQWLVLRTQIKRIGWWVGATTVGYASIGLLPLIGNVLQPGWLNWAYTLIISGKMHWIARVLAPGDPVSPGWEAASWQAGAVTLVLFGFVLGIGQWFVLRGRVRQAGWWIAISALGWALAAALSLPFVSWAGFVTLSGDLPAAVAGAGIAWLLRRSVTA